MLTLILFVLTMFVIFRICKAWDKREKAASKPYEGIEEHYLKAARDKGDDTDPRFFVPSYVCIDVETTGLEPSSDRITQISLRKVQGGEVVKSWSSYVYPGISVPLTVQNLTGITDERLSLEPAFYQIEDEILSFISDSIIVGHNVEFDLDFLSYELGESLPNKYVDTLELSRKYFKCTNYKLGTLCDYFDIPLEAHDADNDSMATVLLFEKMKQVLKKADVKIDRKAFIVTPHVVQRYRARKDFIVRNPSDKLKGEYYFIAGNIKGYRRRQLLQRILCLGGEISRGPVRKTRWVVIAEGATSDVLSALEKRMSEENPPEEITAEELLRRLEFIEEGPPS